MRRPKMQEYHKSPMSSPVGCGIMVKLLRALWTAWKKEDLSAYPPPPPDKLPIIATRWVRDNPECRGWHDWNTAGVIDIGRPVWCVPEEQTERSDHTVMCAVTAQQDIAHAIAAGCSHGTLEYNADKFFHLQWRLM